MALRKQKSLRRFKIACLQTDAGPDWQKNLQQARLQIRRALAYKPHLIALPEMFYWRGPSRQLSRIALEVTPLVIEEFRRLARTSQTAFLLGSLLEPAPRGKFYNTSVLISESGKIEARYRKIHLFDNRLKNVKSRESQHIAPGRKVVTGKIQGIRVGLAVCYDLRFPELFRRLAGKGARIIFLPANFTFETGKAHWEVLLRARAIENQIFIAAPAQTGIHPSTRIRSFGTSLIVDPWGKVLRKGSPVREQVLTAALDLRRQTWLRKIFPVLTHRVLT